ncbi:GNAT family N-acetyltransferase [Bacillus daqingensis]|uniref:GNAT family N-acetyltransferase n=1 Tax=Bacillus daqingensis TaxID=872396 RepID=A0ABV9NSB5_9BACI
MGLVVHSSRLTLKALSLDLFPHLRQANYFPAHLDAHLQGLRMNSACYGWGPWIIYLRDSDEVIGDIGFKGKPDNWHTVEVGYGIRKPYRLQGYATEALEAILNYCFQLTEVTRVTAECRHDNLGSIRVLENNHLFPETEHLQMVNWQLTKNQYFSKRNALAASSDTGS